MPVKNVNTRLCLNTLLLSILTKCRNGESFQLQTNRENSVSPICINAHPANFHDFMLDILIDSRRDSPILKSNVLIATADDSKKLSKHRNGHSNKNKTIKKLQRYERIPAWPLNNGIRLNAIERLPGGSRVASRVESKYGGRDCPNIFINTDEIRDTSPFMMFVHHNHSFRLNDPLRWVEKFLMPEGFPSHAHRGMLTVTICLSGGMIHRDSLGIKQFFGADKKKYSGKHTQALNFGAGLVHELMWDNTPHRITQNFIAQEIYQIWVDLPSDQRMSNVYVELLGGEDETPTVVEKQGRVLQSTTLVVAGSHKDRKSRMLQKSEFTILQVTVEPGKTWTHSSPTCFDSIILYMRKGGAKIEGREVPMHCTAFCSTDGEEIMVVAGKQGADFLFLTGEPLHQNVVARGSMVGETGQDVAQAVKDANSFKMGKPWHERLSDAQWHNHISRYPCEYNSE